MSKELLEHFETLAVQEQLDGKIFFDACMKYFKVPNCNLITCQRQCKFQELQVISAGEKLHMKISSFQVPYHKIVGAYLFLQSQASHCNDFPMEEVQIVLHVYTTVKHV